MKKRAAVLAMAFGLYSSSLHSQMRERVDPVTGNYVPIRDPFLNEDPDPDKPNPNRLSNRLSKRNSTRAAPAAPVSQMSSEDVDDGLTPAQRMARFAANNAQAGSLISVMPESSASEVTADGFVSMSGMATYIPPDTANAHEDPFLKPEWWPR